MAAKPESQVVQLSGRKVAYSIRVSPRAQRRRIRVTPNGVEVVLPRGVERDSARAFLLQSEAWVLEQLDFIERSCGAIRRRSQPGAVLLRGEEKVVLIVQEASTRHYGLVREEQDDLVVRVPNGNKDVAGRTLELWFRRQARADLQAALDRRASEMKVRFGRLYVMNQRTRWGGCSARSNLSFSWRLIMAPPAVLDYLAVHELVHLVEPNHSTRFWLTVKSLCPEFERHKRWLRENEWRLRLPLI